MPRFNFELIDLISKHEALYNRNHHLRRDCHAIQKIWEEIADQLNCSVDSCRRRWTSLRTNYGKKKKEMCQNPSSTVKERWPEYSRMQFLDSFIKHRSLNIKEEVDATDSYPNDNEEIEITVFDNFDGDTVWPKVVSTESALKIEDSHEKSIEIVHATEESSYVDFNAKLIDSVSKRESLYNRPHFLHKDESKEQMLWEEVASEVNSTADTCKRRWKSLRTAYGKKHRELCQILSNLNEPSHYKFTKWRYYDKMRFLDSVIKYRNLDCQLIGRRLDVKSFAAAEGEDVNENCENFMVDIDGFSDSEQNDTAVTQVYDELDENLQKELDFNTKLIRSVSVREPLFNGDCGCHAESDLANKLWDEVAKEVKSTVKACRRRWKTLLSRFEKIHRGVVKHPVASAATTVDSKRWQHYDEMVFLLPYIKHRALEYDTAFGEEALHAPMDQEDFSATAIDSHHQPSETTVGKESIENDVWVIALDLSLRIIFCIQLPSPMYINDDTLPEKLNSGNGVLSMGPSHKGTTGCLFRAHRKLINILN